MQEQTFHVARHGQKGIVLGKNSQNFEWISSAARTGLVRIAERPLHLFLIINVRED